MQGSHPFLKHDRRPVTVEWADAASPEGEAARRARRVLSLDAYAVTMVIAVLLVATMHFLGDGLGIDTGSASVAFIIYSAISAVTLGNLRLHGHSRFGAANIVTTIRVAITSITGGLVLASPQFGEGFDHDALWWLGLLVASALILDGFDGYLARRTGTVSRFGARFDMEIDALLILVLSLAAYELGKAGAWVLLIGLMRYVYLGAQAVFPALQGELPHSMRRKVICVIQGAVLCLLIFPFVAPPVSGLLAAGALLSLIYSFGVDVVYLLQTGRGSYAA